MRRPVSRTEIVTVVSGLPRSGTSMMMKMLQAGGLDVLTDGIRAPNADNPRGYYEFERVKKLREGDIGWLPQARGKAVKVISELLRWLPPGFTYRVIFMRRAMSEVLASQRTMMERRGTEEGQPDDESMAEFFRKHLEAVDAWLRERPQFAVLYVEYVAVVADPLAHARRVNAFLGGSLDVAKMAAVVDSELYRQRRPNL